MSVIIHCYLCPHAPLLSRGLFHVHLFTLQDSFPVRMPVAFLPPLHSHPLHSHPSLPGVHHKGAQTPNRSGRRGIPSRHLIGSHPRRRSCPDKGSSNRIAVTQSRGWSWRSSLILWLECNLNCIKLSHFVPFLLVFFFGLVLLKGC